MKTYSPKPQDIQRRWYVIDASDQVLGRLASEAAAILRGKHKPIFAPHMDTGDHVVIVNADKIVLTGGKETKKVAYSHSGYPGGIKQTRYDRLMADRPVFVIEKAVRGMLPKNRLGRAQVKKLHVMVGPEHPHRAQRPVPYTLGSPPIWEGLPKAEVPAKGGQAGPAVPAPAKPKPSGRKPATTTTTAANATTTAGPTGKTKPTPKTTSAKSAAKRTSKSTAKRTSKSTARSTAKSAAKRTAAKKTAKTDSENEEE